jgi:hypothetical protein
MSTAIVSTMVSALIAGVFSLVGVVLNNKLASKSGSIQTASVMQSVVGASQGSTPVGTIIDTPQSTNRVSFGKVLIHVGIIQLIGNVMGLIIGFFTLRLIGASLDTYMVAVFIINTLVLVVCLAWSGTKVDRAIMWKHLTYVSIGVVVVDLLIDILFGAAINGPIVVGSLIQTFVAMGIAGSIVRARKPQLAAAPPSISPYPQYYQQPSVPPSPGYAAPQGITWGYLAFSDGKQVRLMGKRVVVGRAKYEPGVTNPEIDLSSQPEASSVSHMHAAFENYGNVFTVTDMQSMNGTVVSGHRLEPYRAISVNDGDTLYFGRVQCAFKKA